jgi:hypothetical protein
VALPLPADGHFVLDETELGELNILGISQILELTLTGSKNEWYTLYLSGELERNVTRIFVSKKGTSMDHERHGLLDQIGWVRT